MPETKWRNPWLDPNVQNALDDGRAADDIWMIQCAQCGNWGYYNQGSHFDCSVCDWRADGDRLDAVIDNGDARSLADLTQEQEP